MPEEEATAGRAEESEGGSFRPLAPSLSHQRPVFPKQDVLKGATEGNEVAGTQLSRTGKLKKPRLRDRHISGTAH